MHDLTGHCQSQLQIFFSKINDRFCERVDISIENKMNDKENKTSENEDFSSDFETKYQHVLARLNDLYNGRLTDEEAFPLAALCLLTQNALFTALKSYDVKSKAFKSDIKFAEAEAYKSLKYSKSDKRMTETELAQLVTIDPAVKEAIEKYSTAETEYKHLQNLQGLLKEAHLTFRSIKKGQ
jgi:hypothetical protein